MSSVPDPMSPVGPGELCGPLSRQVVYPTAFVQKRKAHVEIRLQSGCRMCLSVGGSNIVVQYVSIDETPPVYNYTSHMIVVNVRDEEN